MQACQLIEQISHTEWIKCFGIECYTDMPLPCKGSVWNVHMLTDFCWFSVFHKNRVHTPQCVSSDSSHGNTTCLLLVPLPAQCVCDSKCESTEILCEKMFFHDASPHSCFLAVLWWINRRNLNYLCQILTFPKILDRLHRGKKKLVTSKSKNYAARVNAVLLCTDSAFHSWDLTCCLVQLAECCIVLMVHCAFHLAECVLL